VSIPVFSRSVSAERIFWTSPEVDALNHLSPSHELCVIIDAR
jgi:hypothetical protein